MSSGHDCFRRRITRSGASQCVAPGQRGAPAALLPYDLGIATHYDVLGVAPDAPARLIRESYRARAREHHPDRVASAGGGADPDEMARINEAYRILGDPGRRALYDRSLIVVPTHEPGRSAGDEHDSDSGDLDAWPEVMRRRNPFDPDGPARMPWRMMFVVAVLGSVLVLVSMAVTDPPQDEVPDGIIRQGSCVTIEPNGDAREVACTGDGDVVVELFVPTGGRCPVDLAPHRDRLGLGVACIRP